MPLKQRYANHRKPRSVKNFRQRVAFSKPRFLVFALIFGAIGGYILYHSFAAPNPNLLGDLNNDNNVNVVDLSILLSDYGTSNNNADLNNDNQVTVIDLSILLSHYGESGGGPVGYTPTYYVSPSGSDNNSGTSSSSPWRTISKVQNRCLQPDDVVAFQGGQTFSDTYLDTSCSGTTASPIVFTSYGTGKAIIAGGVWFNGGHHDIKLDNLDLTDSSGSIVASCGSCTSNPAYNITIQNSNIHDTPGVGIEPNYGSGWLIANNTITNTGDSGIIDYYSSGATITRNTISNTGGNTSITYGKHGIYSKGVGTTTISYNNFSNNLNGQSVSIRTHGQYIYGNVIHDTGYAFAFFDYDESAPPQGTTYIYDNLLYNVSGYGFYDSNQTDPQGSSPTVSFVIASNTFVASGGEMFNLSETPSGMSITTVNNIFSGSFGNAYRGCATCTEHHNLWFGGSSNVPSGTNDVFTNPLLNAAPTLSLQAGSPAIDKGTTSVPGLTYSLNSDGAPLHYKGSAPDLGGVEF